MPTRFRTLPSADTIKKYYTYCPKTGFFIYKNGQKAGRAAGHKRVRRGGKAWLILVTIESVQYPAHRLAWRYMTNEDPTLSIDHIDRDPFNNSWSNLRLADDFLQANNRTYGSTSPGVNFHKATGKWVARIQRNNKRVHLGVFHTREEAIVCRENAMLTHASP